MKHSCQCGHNRRGGCCGVYKPGPPLSLSRRSFMTTCGVVGAVPMLAASSTQTTWKGGEKHAPTRKPLVVKPVLLYDLPKRRHATSWRNWGSVQSPEAVQKEMAVIKKELAAMAKKAGFPMTILPLGKAQSANDLNAMSDIKEADVTVAYAAGGWGTLLGQIVNMARNTVFFLRHRSGATYLWYEILSPRFLRSHHDELKQTKVDFDDVVVDEYDDLAVKLRALCGVKNTLGTKIVCIGNAAGWGPQGGKAPEFAKKYFNLNMIPFPYSELKKLINSAMADPKVMARARKEAGEYLAIPGTKLECARDFVDRCFVLYYIFRDIMKQAGAPSITVNACMGTIIQQSQTTACLTLQLLNDQGFPSFCESDFVVIPSGLLLNNICNTPVFLHNPTYPHHGMITVAHCTGPRMMNGKDIEPARIMTHFESDFGAAPKVERRKGQAITVIDPDFSSEKYLLFRGVIDESPFHAICRDQMDVLIHGSWKKLRDDMRGFHWMSAYGDYRTEVKYALKKIGITVDDLTEPVA